MSIIQEKDQVIIDMNENAKTMLGYDREEVLNRTTKDLNLWVVPGERDKHYRAYKQNRKNHMKRAGAKKREEIDVVINATRVELYREPYILSSVRDITARKQAEEKFKTAFTLSLM
jgi:PAS domain S-box-containing protein